ncbi:argininosuccinate lyase [Rhodobacteraceae bacterium F11138]|nr:argininosuccinate lyase [Rhodobacteraceae bacterium F11138]
MKKLIAGLCLFVLAACGVDGEPTPPPPKSDKSSGIRVSGEARAGIAVSEGRTRVIY